MAKEPNPRHYGTATAFRDAYVEWATAGLPRATEYDSFDSARAKQRALTVASIDAAEVARDIYDYEMEMVAEEYERGIGASWL